MPSIGTVINEVGIHILRYTKRPCSRAKSKQISFHMKQACADDRLQNVNFEEFHDYCLEYP